MKIENRMCAKLWIRILCMGGCLLASGGLQVKGEELSQGDRVVFLGDSITFYGTKPDGYVSLVSQGIARAYPERGIEVIGAGVSGHKVPDCQERLDRDVLQQQPTLVVIYIGINDVWHWRNNRGTPKEEFAQGLRGMIGRIREAGARVLLCTPTVIGEKTDGTNRFDALLDEYAAITRGVAADMEVQLLDLRKAFLEYLREKNPDNVEKGILTFDRVHLTPLGNQVLADRMLDALNVPRVPSGEDRLLADFEGADYGDWTATGDAFGSRPAGGTLPRQRRVSGFIGQQLVNTFRNVDQSTGTLTSPAFILEHKFLHVRIGGGNHPGKTCMNLLVEDTVVASLTGDNRETLTPRSVDLQAWRGKPARIQIVDSSKDSWGHVLVDHLVLSDQPSPPDSPKTPPSAVPTEPEIELSFLPMAERRQREAAYREMTLAEQAEAVETDPEVLRYRRMREAKAADPYRPLYHLSTPEGLMNDPNGFCFWNGNYHLFYQLQAAGTGTMQWGHAVSPDLVQWKDLPMAIRHEDGSGRIFSGQVLVEEDRVIAMFHDTSRGNCIAIADDPLLLAFRKTGVDRWGGGKYLGEGFQKLFDPCIWKGKDGAYYSVSGVCKNGSRTSTGFPVADLFRSEDLKTWTYLGTLLQDEDWTRMGLGPGDDAAVPNFQPIARRDGTPSGKHMFLWFSHGKGAHALVGTYDEEAQHFSPEHYHRITYGPVYKGTLHAPSAMIDDRGRLLAVYNLRENLQNVREALDTQSANIWYGVMSLVHHYWLDEQDQLRMEPAGDLASLRVDPREVAGFPLAAEEERVLEEVSGRAMELRVVLDPGQAERVGVTVLRSPDGKERTRIFYDRTAKTLVLDVSEGSHRNDVPPRAAEIGPFELQPGKKLDLRVFIDRSVVEVFANERRSLTARVYPAGEQSTGVSLFAEGGPAELDSLRAWRMKTIWPELRSP